MVESEGKDDRKKGRKAPGTRVANKFKKNRRELRRNKTKQNIASANHKEAKSNCRSPC